ncbi:hypothetical protein SRABI118_02418 [Massilia sp. Bi118]|uniref:hypothetical protein n=1 Tax=Massilia sp. Bi118 TaxID=2822346 RepID=UPI001DB1037A|nr:hypothetical protein [Massilia sp. Bi118]CAH0229019.1 hypothetical protein SRABI118_02418 [Massilia sp. Bi118]
MALKRSEASLKRAPARPANKRDREAETEAGVLLAGSDAAWTRDAVTFRLTEQRKRELRALSHDGGELPSPTAALDQAIELAIAARAREADHQPVAGRDEPDIAALADELRDAARALAGAASGWQEIRAQLARVAADCAELRAAIASAAMLADGVPVGETDAPAPLREWLERQAGPATAWLVVKASWLGKRPASAGLSTWEFEARELGRDGQGHASQAESCRVLLGPAPADGPLARLDRDGGCVLSCARNGQGWRVSLRCALEGGKLGEAFAELSI